MNQAGIPDNTRVRRGGSFVWKITLRQVFRNLGRMIVLDLLIALLFWGGVWFAVERCAVTLSTSGADVGAGRRGFNPGWTDGFFTVVAQPEQPAEPILEWFHESIIMNLDLLPGVRDLEQMQPDSEWYRSPSTLRYTISTPSGEGASLLISFVPGALWDGFYICFLILLACEGISLVSDIFKISRSVRHTLLPISQLTIAAKQSISAQDSPHRQSEKHDDFKLDGTIDTLNAITESHLDTRISVENEREELRELAEAINAMLDRLDSAYRAQLRFVSDASHELRTPISVIQGYANLLDRWGKDDQKTLDEAISAIKTEASGMKELVEQLLFLARSDNNSILLKPEVFDIAEMVRDVARESEMIDTSHRIACPKLQSISVFADAQLLKQAIRIFVDNALKYTPEDGRITLAAVEKNGQAVISVSDTGIGIADGDLPQLFNRFFRADASRTRQTGGAGLGLSIAKWIVDNQGGTIDVLSREDIGTRISVSLPIAQADPSSEIPA